VTEDSLRSGLEQSGVEACLPGERSVSEREHPTLNAVNSTSFEPPGDQRLAPPAIAQLLSADDTVLLDRDPIERTRVEPVRLSDGSRRRTATAAILNCEVSRAS
jgi:hypothetical protein